MSETGLVIAGNQGRLFVDGEEIPCESVNLVVRQRMKRKIADDRSWPVYEPVGEPVAKLSYVDSEGAESSIYVVAKFSGHQPETDEVSYTLTPLPDFDDAMWEVWNTLQA